MSDKTFSQEQMREPVQNEPYTGIRCPHCGYETGIEPALVDPDGPMLYCKECDEPLFPIDYVE